MAILARDHTTTEKLIVLDNLKDIHAGIPNGRFARVHKSFIVALEKIDTIERSRIFIGDEQFGEDKKNISPRYSRYCPPGPPVPAG